jgi:VanZ family protein
MTTIALLYAVCLTAGLLAADSGWVPQVVQHVHDLPYCDKLLHFLMFGLLALTANSALAGRGKRMSIRKFALISMILLALAIGEEYSNQFVAVRDWSLGDMAANCLGVVSLGIVPVWWWNRRRTNNIPI